MNQKEVAELVGFPIMFFPYWELKDQCYFDIFYNDCCLINYVYDYEDGVYNGHWCCLVRDPKQGRITFFNPSGGMIDDMLDYIQEVDVDLAPFPYISDRLSKSSYDIYYMDKKLQADNTNTCGIWCGLFMRYKDIFNEKEFSNYFKMFNDADIINYYKLILSGNKKMTTKEELRKEVERLTKLLKDQTEIISHLSKDEDMCQMKLKGGKTKKPRKNETTPGELNERFNTYRNFIKEVNNHQTMMNFKGVGKRKAQSYLYQLKKDAGDDHVKEILDDLKNYKPIKEKHIKEIVRERRKELGLKPIPKKKKSED